MLKSLLASALFAGLIAGLFAAGLQQAFLVPLIAETVRRGRKYGSHQAVWSVSADNGPMMNLIRDPFTWDSN